MEQLSHLNHENNYSEDIYSHNVDFPEYISMEWELIYFIISYTGMNYSYYKNVSFSSNEIIENYNETFKYSSYDKTPKVFNKVYGHKGLHFLLSFRNGVTYTHNMWHIEVIPFLKSLEEQYNEDIDTYGNFN